MRLLALIRKECLILLRNPHALAVLFIMPALFVLLMSMAMSNLGLNRPPEIDLQLQLGQDDSDSRFFAQALHSQLQPRQFSVVVGQPSDPSSVIQVQLPEQFSSQLLDNTSDALNLVFPASTDAASRQHLRGAVQIALAQTRLMAYLLDTGDLDASSSLEQRLAIVRARTHSSLNELEQLASGSFSQQANPTQHNVSAWLIFGMFFIILPMANSFQREHASGTLLRLRCMGMGLGTLALGKLPAYFLINLIQFALLLAIGVWALPLIGVPALELPGTANAYVLLALSLSLATCSLGLAIAALARSTEQALLLSGGLNIILAAIGGIMVPKSVMPDSMRQLAELSPMSWGLDAFSTLLVGHGDSADIFPLCLRLLMFAAISLSLGLYLFHRRLRETQWTTQY